MERCRPHLRLRLQPRQLPHCNLALARRAPLLHDVCQLMGKKRAPLHARGAEAPGAEDNALADRVRRGSERLRRGGRLVVGVHPHMPERVPQGRFHREAHRGFQGSTGISQHLLHAGGRSVRAGVFQSADGHRHESSARIWPQVVRVRCARWALTHPPARRRLRIPAQSDIYTRCRHENLRSDARAHRIPSSTHSFQPGAPIVADRLWSHNALVAHNRCVATERLVAEWCCPGGTLPAVTGMVPDLRATIAGTNL